MSSRSSITLEQDGDIEIHVYREHNDHPPAVHVEVHRFSTDEWTTAIVPGVLWNRLMADVGATKSGCRSAIPFVCSACGRESEAIPGVTLCWRCRSGER
jgi:hypothetical protein